jgi:protease II
MPTMPSMPTISSPSVNKNGTQKNNSATKTEKTQSAKTSSNITAQSLLQMSSSNSLSSITDLASVLSGVSSENATEDDLKRISELFGTPLSSLSTTTLNSTSSSSNILLSQILQKLEELQNQIDKMNEVPNSTNEQTKISTEDNIDNSINKKILRFRINNYELTKSFTTLFFSEPEADGSFLLTGDRTYNLYGKQMTETFYMLFKNENGNNFEVAVALNQNDENPNSFLYKFAKDSPYQSQRTGNLFFINSNKNDLKIDILIEN